MLFISNDLSNKCSEISRGLLSSHKLLTEEERNQLIAYLVQSKHYVIRNGNMKFVRYMNEDDYQFINDYQLAVKYKNYCLDLIIY